MNGNSNGSIADDLQRRVERERIDFVESAEEVNFRFSALLRAYTSPTPDVGAILKRADKLRDSWDDFSDFLNRLIDAGKEGPRL